MGFKEANELSDVELAEVLDFADTVQGWVKSVRAEAFKRACRKNGAIPGWKLAEGSSSREWAIAPEEVPQSILALSDKVDYEELFSRSLKSVAQVEKVLKQFFKGRGHKEVWEKFNALVKTNQSASTSLVRETDARPEVRRGHEFATLAKKVHESQNSHKEVDDLL